MGYTKQNFTDGQILTAQSLNNIENGIIAVEKALSEAQFPSDGEMSGVFRELSDIVKGVDAISITDLSAYEEIIGLPNQSNNATHWVVKESYKHIVVPVPEKGCTFTMTASSNTGTMYCGLQSYERPTTGSSPLVYSEHSDWNMRWNLISGTSVTKTIADDVNYILIVVFNNNVDSYPTAFEIGKPAVPGLDEKIENIKSEIKPFAGKKLFAFGDSITYGYITVDGVRQDVRYTEIIREKLGCDIVNFGSSGAATGRLCTIMTGGEIDRRSDVDPSSPTLCTDYSDADIVTIMIGTNSGIYVGGIASKKEDIPNVCGATVKAIADGGTIEYDGKTIGTMEEYWALFPNSFHGNLSLCIEWVQWKNPNAKIYLITPPPNNIGDWRNFVYTEVRPAIYEIAHHYGVEVIDAQVNSGVNMHNLLDYTFDGTHFNHDGREKWGNYIANQIK